MRRIGFSTGALARADFRRALEMLQGKGVHAIELSALRQGELLPLVEQLDDINIEQFTYISFHAPSSISQEFELTGIELLQGVKARGWPIVVHPDAMHNMREWSQLGRFLCIENMDKRKRIGQTAADLALIFNELPEASFCLDLGHVRQVDPTMSEAVAIVTAFRDRLTQLHVSEVNAQSKHDALTLEAIMAFQRVASLIPDQIPIILESRVSEGEIESEIANALQALKPAAALAIAGD
jgi:hypothetical protein